MEIKLEKSLSKEEINNLFIEYKNGNKDAREKIILSNMRLIMCVLKELNFGDKEELFQYGVIGLIQAVDNFDINRGIAFSTYARVSIINEIRNNITDSSLYVARKKRVLHNQIKKYIDMKKAENNEEPSIKELSEIFDVKEEVILSLLDNNYYQDSLEEKIENAQEIADTSDIEKDVLNKVFVDELFLCLDERKQRIVKKFHGIDCKQREIKEIAKEEKITISRVNQILKESHLKMRRKGVVR